MTTNDDRQWGFWEDEGPPLDAITRWVDETITAATKLIFDDLDVWLSLLEDGSIELTAVGPAKDERDIWTSDFDLREVFMEWVSDYDNMPAISDAQRADLEERRAAITKMAAEVCQAIDVTLGKPRMPS